MTSLATRNANAHGVPARDSGGGDPGVSFATSTAMRLDELYTMAERVAESKLFAVDTPQQAFTLMLLAQADGIPAILAMRQYHVLTIKGRTVPALRSDATQGKMIAAGWRITPVDMTAARAGAVFTHPAKMPQGYELVVTIDQYKHLKTKDTWVNHPDDMLWARLVCKACRRFDPGLIAGIYSPEELEDSVYMDTPPALHARSTAEAIEAVRKADVPVPGQPEGVDIRPYAAVSTDAALAVGYKPADLHKHLMLRALQTDHAEGPVPSRIGEAVKRLAAVYAEHRDWLREEVAAFCVARTFDREDEAAEEPAEAEKGGAADPEFDFEPGADG